MIAVDADQGEPTPAVRVSEPDRNRVVDILKDRTADGTLTLDEFAQRVDRALSARDAKELGSVTADLPVAPPEQTRRRQQRQHLLAVMGGAHTRGRWRCGDSITAIAVMGGCH